MGFTPYNASSQSDPSETPSTPVYEIRVQGCMDEGFWVDWFGEMEFIVDLEQAETTLRGSIADQAELYGVLSRLRNKGLTLISVQQIRQDTGGFADSGATG